MDLKSAVVKSKSSNRTMPSKLDANDKKSRSNAEFKPNIVKKRGVYVEKRKNSPIKSNEGNNMETQRKPPPRPRPGQKRFLASVLTILSKSTTGTQHPDLQDKEIKTNDNETEKAKPRWRNRKNDDTSALSKKVTIGIGKTKAKKFRSRVLKQEMMRAENEQKVVVLKSKREISQTPSNNSNRSRNTVSFKWSDILKQNESPHRTTVKEYLEKNVYSGVAEGLAKNVLEEKEIKKEKTTSSIRKIDDDPVTLAAQIANEEKNDKKLLNFFVDLLETTFSVYNVKAEYDDCSRVSEDPKTVFEIDESIAKKLVIKEQSKENIEKSQSYRKKDVKNDRNPIPLYNHENPLEIKLSYHKPSNSVKPKITEKSSSFSRRFKVPSKSNSFYDAAKKKPEKKAKKKTLLNVLKEQLQTENLTFSEPQNLYEALKLIARNKKRYEKSLHFNRKIQREINSDVDEEECTFKRRKIISFKSKRNRKDVFPKTVPKYSDYNRKKNYNEIDYKRSIASYHSLEVYGYDYEDSTDAGRKWASKIHNYNYSSPSSSDVGMP